MSHGNIDDILARISRLEKKASTGRIVQSDADPEPSPMADEPQLEPEEILSPETFREVIEEPGQSPEPGPEPYSDDNTLTELTDFEDFEEDDDTSVTDLFEDETAAEMPSEDVQELDLAEGMDGDSDSSRQRPKLQGYLDEEQPPVFKIGSHGLETVKTPHDTLQNEPDHGPIKPEMPLDEPVDGDEDASDAPPTVPAGVVRVGTGIASSNGLSDLFVPDDKTLGFTNKTLGEILAERGVASREQILAAENVMAQTPGKELAEILIEQGVDEGQVCAALAEHHGMVFERVDLDLGFDGGFDGKILQRLGIPFCSERMILPLRTEGNRIVVAANRPDATFELDEIKRRLGCTTPKLVLTTSEDIKAALEIAGAGDLEQQQQSVDLNDILEDVEESDVEIEQQAEQTVDLEQQAGESPVIRYVNYIIQTAVREGASDIHIEPSEKKIKVRLRVDGVLFESMNPPASMAAAITSRIKIMANLDISERRLPQDGRIRCTVQGRKLDLRVSTLPASYGEKIVMRILDTKSINVKLEDLGFDDTTLEIWRNQVKQAHGIVLVTGPTGSGKTTTLYSSLRQLDKNKLNISTCEDPVEYHLDGITQTQTHEKIGMSFAKVLRALLRQDPDVIMVGEIRDQETAHIAIQAALTGHLVLSTLHTNDAPSSLTRLVNIGIEPFLVGAAINAVLAQRLVRKLCMNCRDLRDPPPEQVEFLELSGIIGQQIYQPVGCDKCRQIGYSGRVGIYELLTIDDQLRDVIARNPNVAEFRQLCLERGMSSLRADGMAKVAAGVTTVAEVLRVTAEH